MGSEAGTQWGVQEIVSLAARRIQKGVVSEGAKPRAPRTLKAASFSLLIAFTNLLFTFRT